MQFITRLRIYLWFLFTPFRVAATFILFTVFYFLPRDMILRARYCNFWHSNYFQKVNALRYKILPKYMTERKRTEGNYTLDPLPVNMENEDIVVRFSGGPDSMLVAAIMAERFKKIHLLTFTHVGVRGVNKSEVGLGFLTAKFGEDKFIHKILSVEEIRTKIYFNNYLVNFFKFGFYGSNVCASCYFSQHAKVIAYCKKYGIRYVTDGITHVRGNRIAFSQMFEIARKLQKLYHEYGIEYLINPSYNLDRSDHELFARGITSIKDIKFTKHHFETQSGCGIGRFLIDCATGYYFIIYGNYCLRRIAPRYYEHIYKVCKQIIDSNLASGGI